MEDPKSTSRKRTREQDDPADSFDPVEAAEVKRLRDDLLGILDDADLDPGTQDLDSLVRSFQEEISSSSSTSASAATVASSSDEEPTVVEVVDLTSESGELGFLLGASDDDLGLPPRARYDDVIGDAWDGEAELAGVPYDYAVGGELWGLEGYVDGFVEGLGFGSGAPYGSYDGDEGYEYVAYDGGLFDYSEVRFDTSDDLSGLSPSWRRGSMPTQ
ncbi:hypothetical protein MLD38_011425 [Melastoma candidum]|uniref:Uncharacterized protein n=1 Tax=Melastoma candidum TaxID=119954 RepID=A0ACB9R4S3_9MYRT|nr:hypothetical protein MLD38_011425 [Melastoma candidum]